LVVFFIADIIDFNAFVNPKALYLTQDLWDKTGSDFWSAFLFETPFALMRGIIWLFIPLMIIFYLYFGYQSHRLFLINKNYNILNNIKMSCLMTLVILCCS